MKGLERITQRIQTDAQGQIEALTAAGRRQAQEITEKYEDQARQLRQADQEKAARDAQQDQRRAQSGADRTRREQLLACKQQLIDDTFRQARQALAETGNGQECDLVLDGTCFRELTRLADAVDCPALTDYLRTRIDGVNLCSAVRAHRLRKGPDFLHKVLLDGGSVPPTALEEAAPADLRELYAATPLREAAGLAEGICAGGGSMTALEKQCDNAVLRLAAKARRTPFGVETALGYLIAAEAELTAVRTIMTGRRAGLSADAIRERLRDIYG